MNSPLKLTKYYGQIHKNGFVLANDGFSQNEHHIRVQPEILNTLTYKYIQINVKEIKNKDDDYWYSQLIFLL